jgi:superfamily I DNA/RNA helicase
MLRIEARDPGLPADFVIPRVNADFRPVTGLSLRDNCRATKALLRVTDRHPSTFAHRRTQTRPAPSLAEGLPLGSHHAENSTTQADWIATRIKSIPGKKHLGRIGILTRTHKRSEAVSRALTQLGIAHLTVGQFDFPSQP